MPNGRQRVAALAGLAIVLGGSGCGRLALEPGPGTLRAEWRVNGEASGQVRRGVPVIVQLRVRNVARLPVRLPADLAPRIAGTAEGTPLGELPAVLRPGGSAEGWWVWPDGWAAGVHEVGFASDAVLAAPVAVMEVSAEPAGPAERIAGRAMVARLTGTEGELAQALVREQEGRDWLPTTRLEVAALFAEAGEPDAALGQYEALAEEVYGVETLPSWLQARMRRVSGRRNSENP